MEKKSLNTRLNSVHDTHFTKPWNSVGYRFDDLYLDGNHATYEVVNERAVRAAAGVMMAVAAIAFVLAYFTQYYFLIRMFTLLAAFDFVVRLVSGLSVLSPFGVIGSVLVRKQRPEWIGAKQKSFAWSLGLIMASIVAYLVNSGQNGQLSSTLCMICIALMWMEATLGICLGCKMYSQLLRWNVIPKTDVRPACPGGVCAVREAEDGCNPTSSLVELS